MRFRCCQLDPDWFFSGLESLKPPVIAWHRRIGGTWWLVRHERTPSTNCGFVTQSLWMRCHILPLIWWIFQDFPLPHCQSLPSFAAFSPNSVMSGTPWAHPLLRRSVTELWTVARLLHGCCTVAVSQCQATRNPQRRKLEQLQYGIEQNLVLAGVAEGKPKRNQRAMVPAEYGELIDNYIQFCMILEIFRRNQLWDIVQDAWCCGRQRLNKNGSYPYVSIILHGNHLFLCHNHGISSCLAPFLTATRDLNLLTLRIFVTSSSPGLWQGAKVPLPHQEGPAMQVSQEMFINLPRLGMKKKSHIYGWDEIIIGFIGFTTCIWFSWTFSHRVSTRFHWVMFCKPDSLRLSRTLMQSTPTSARSHRRFWTLHGSP